MRKIKLYIATSLDGKIANSDGSVDWLDQIPKPEESDYGYAEFYNSIDTTIQGYNTYNQIINWGIDFPYSDKKNFVLTNKKRLEDTEHVSFITKNHIGFISELKKQEGKDIWLVGGGQVNTMLFNANLIDEIQVFIMPIVLSGGISLFESIPIEKQLKLLEANHYSSGTVELKYRVQ